MELPFEYKPSNLKNLILKLRSNKYRPIVAHPERYTYVQENPNTLIELIDMGVLFQSNYGSIIGIYGKKAKKTVEVLLKNNFVHFLGSDVHREKTIYTEMPEILKRMKHIIPDEQLDELTTLNAKLVLSDEDIDVRRPIKAKRALLNKFI